MAIDDLGKKALRVVKVVWSNDPPKRYIPLAYGKGPGWGVWDRKRDCYVEGNRELRAIDPHEEIVRPVEAGEKGQSQ